MKYTISTSETQVLFTDSKGKTEKFDFVAPIADSEAISALRKEITARHNATQATLSLLVNLMDNPALDTYKGKTPANEGLSKEFRSAAREIEVEYLKPRFCEPLTAKGNNIAQVQSMWTSFLEDSRKGGVWSNVSATVRQYFAIAGKLPCLYVNGHPQKDKLLSVDAMLKEIANMRTSDETLDRGIAGKLADLLTMVKDRKDNTKLGETSLALASLAGLLIEFKAIERMELDAKSATQADAAQVQHMKAIEAITQSQIDAKQAEPQQVKATAKAVKAQESITAKAKAIADKAMQATKKAIETAPQ